jgi:hypothetical protein
MTAGGNKLDYPGDASSPAVSMLDAKLHINSTISDAKHGARYLGLNIKNFYLGTPMSYFQYILVQPSIIPKEVWDDHHYTIPIASDGYAYLEIRRGMYGLKEAGILAFNQLVQKLKPAGYEPIVHSLTSGLLPGYPEPENIYIQLSHHRQRRSLLPSSLSLRLLSSIPSASFQIIPNHHHRLKHTISSSSPLRSLRI